MKFLSIVTTFLALSLASCASTTPPEAAAPQAREMSRDDAILAARTDAIVRFRMTDAAPVSVRRSGPFWVVALRGAAGPSVRYAIIAADGTIRERSMIQ